MEQQIEGFLCGRNFKCMIDKQMEEIRKKHNLKKAETDVIMYLFKSKENNTGTDVLECLKINKGYLSQIMDNLCKKGYVVAVPDKNDRRYIHYELTESSLEITKEIEEVKNKINKKIFAGFTPEEIEFLKNTAQRISNNIQEIIKNGI